MRVVERGGELGGVRGREGVEGRAVRGAADGDRARSSAARSEASKPCGLIEYIGCMASGRRTATHRSSSSDLPSSSTSVLALSSASRASSSSARASSSCCLCPARAASSCSACSRARLARRASSAAACSARRVSSCCAMQGIGISTGAGQSRQEKGVRERGVRTSVARAALSSSSLTLSASSDALSPSSAESCASWALRTSICGEGRTGVRSERARRARKRRE